MGIIYRMRSLLADIREASNVSEFCTEDEVRLALVELEMLTHQLKRELEDNQPELKDNQVEL